MKKYFWCALFIVLLFSVLGFTRARANSDIKVMLDGEYISFDVQPRLIDDRTMVPMRGIFEELGATVNWDAATQTVVVQTEETIVSCTIGKKELIINGVKKAIDAAPCIVLGRTLVPIRFISEAMNCTVSWNYQTRTVLIFKKTKNEVDTFYKVNDVLLNYTHATKEYLVVARDILEEVIGKLKIEDYNSSYFYYDELRDTLVFYFPNHERLMGAKDKLIQEGEKILCIETSGLSENLSKIVYAYKAYHEECLRLFSTIYREYTIEEFPRLFLEESKQETLGTILVPCYQAECSRFNLPVEIPEVLRLYQK